MRTIDTWLQAYAASHRHPVNERIHRIAVPIIVLDVLGFAHAVAPAAAWLLVASALAFYARLSRPLAAGMAVLAVGALALVAAAARMAGDAFLPALGAVFVVTWAAQFVGHRLEGARPAFQEDLTFLLIGPLWLLADVYDRAGIAWAPTADARHGAPPARRGATPLRSGRGAART